MKMIMAPGRRTQKGRAVWLKSRQKVYLPSLSLEPTRAPEPPEVWFIVTKNVTKTRHSQQSSSPFLSMEDQISFPFKP